MSRTALHAILVGLVLASLCASAPAAAAPSQPPDGYGIHVEAFQQLNARQVNVRVSTAALMRPVDVRILVPDDYDDAATQERRYPVLYLFHGTSGRASDWVNAGRAEQTTAGVALIVVMPDIGFDGDGGGWFADWFNGGAGGPPMWETFHIAQLVPWIDANLRTIAARSGRAVAGLSQGGFGSLSYAARHPDMFTSAAAFSGGCEIARDQEAINTATPIIQYTTSVLSGFDKDAIFGPRATQELNWQAHDPATLVTNLRGMDILLWTGNGDPGPLDPDPPDPGAIAIELITFGATRLFHGHLDDARIPHVYNNYGPGTHIFPYWARDLEEYVGPLMDRFDNLQPPPRSISYLSADDDWEQWGWSVALQRPEPAFSHLRYARKSGFALTGTGLATVQTPSLFLPGARVRVIQRGPVLLSKDTLTVGPSGRLEITVPLSDDARPGTTRVSLRVLPDGPQEDLTRRNGDTERAWWTEDRVSGPSGRGGVPVGRLDSNRLPARGPSGVTRAVAQGDEPAHGEERRQRAEWHAAERRRGRGWTIQAREIARAVGFVGLAEEPSAQCLASRSRGVLVRRSDHGAEETRVVGRLAGAAGRAPLDGRVH